MPGWRENMEDGVRMSGAGHPFRMPNFEERMLTFQWYSTFIAGSEQLSQFCKQASQSVAATSCQGDCFCPACIRFTIKGCAMVLTLWVFHGRRNGNRVSWLPLYICLAFLVLLLKTPSCAFGRPKQQSASEVRERTGHDSRVKVRDSLENPLLPLSNQEKQLLRRISSASERRNWWEVQSCFSKYPGKALQIYGAAMNAALRCRKYEEGALIYEKCRETCEEFDAPIFTSALRIFGKLGKPEKVRVIWDEAREKCTLSHMLVASRLHAAADEGDVETTAAMLDLLNTSKLEINSIVITSAIRSCWGWGAKQHGAAKYFWDLFPAFALLRGPLSLSPL